ncbi:uncharacterized protein [Drosophila takahashii]|uniref:uncharacterized protein n=1 Tax=Drosophila takahashii TaxID=29030 RepID=UPI0038991F6B
MHDRPLFYYSAIGCAAMGGPGDTQQNEQNNMIIINDPRVLKSFVRLVYIFTIIFCLCSVVPWLTISATGLIVDQSIPVPSFVWLILAFICLITLSCCGQLLCWPVDHLWYY